MSDDDREDPVRSALAVLDAFMDALNRGDEAGLNETLHFPRIRIGGDNAVDIFEARGDYTLSYFIRRTRGLEWHCSAWDERRAVHVWPDKVHFDVRFTRYRADGSPIRSYRALYVVVRRNGRWGIQVRSSSAL